MKQPSARWVIAVLLATTVPVAVGCEATESGEARTLIGPFQSYQAPSDAADLLRQRNLTWSVEEEDALPEGDPRPRFSVVKWQVESFDEGDLSGAATFVFFNDRLAEVVVVPDDPSMLPSEQEAQRTAASSVRVRVDRDFRGKRYISYEDVHLREEKEAWLRKHS